MALLSNPKRFGFFGQLHATLGRPPPSGRAVHTSHQAFIASVPRRYGAAPMRLPNDFADLLTPSGRRILDGKAHRGVLATGRRFVAFDDAVSPGAARAVLAELERAFTGQLKRLEQRIPPESTWGMTENYAEALPKTVRVHTAMLESRRAASFKIAHEIGLVSLLRSESFRVFAEHLNGRAVRTNHGVQLLCYAHGDYSGPHNDHHPEDLKARDGYLDVHLTFVNRFVERQLLVYESNGHLNAVQDVNALGLVTAYRLPFWHYTTPLEGRAAARRWVLLGTFVDR